MKRPYTLADWSAANERVNALHELGRNAEALKLEDWADRIFREADEMQAEAETIQLDLIARGIEP